MLDRHDEAGRAETTLAPSPIAVSFLDRGQAAVFTDTFDSRDLLPSQLAASIVQESIGMPSTCTVQIRRKSRSQPRLDPVSCKVQAESVQQERAGLERKFVGTAV